MKEPRYIAASQVERRKQGRAKKQNTEKRKGLISNLTGTSRRSRMNKRLETVDLKQKGDSNSDDARKILIRE